MTYPNSVKKFREILSKQSSEDILNIIYELQCEIQDIKRLVEQPHLNWRQAWTLKKVHGLHNQPEACTRISRLREYITIAKEALRNSGFIYADSPEEAKSKEFDARIADIKKITLITYTMPNLRADGRKSLVLDAESVKVTTGHPLTPDQDDAIEESFFTKEQVLQQVRNLHLGEYRHKYDCFTDYGIKIYDGFGWKLRIEYHTHEPFEVSGNNVTPYNYHALRKLCSYTKQ